MGLPVNHSHPFRFCFARCKTCHTRSQTFDFARVHTHRTDVMASLRQCIQIRAGDTPLCCGLLGHHCMAGSPCETIRRIRTITDRKRDLIVPRTLQRINPYDSMINSKGHGFRQRHVHLHADSDKYPLDRQRCLSCHHYRFDARTVHGRLYQKRPQANARASIIWHTNPPFPYFIREFYPDKPSAYHREALHDFYNPEMDPNSWTLA